MTSLHVLHTQNSTNIASLSAIELNSIFGVHFNNTADTFGFTRVRIQYRVAFIHLA